MEKLMQVPLVKLTLFTQCSELVQWNWVLLAVLRKHVANLQHIYSREWDFFINKFMQIQQLWRAIILFMWHTFKIHQQQNIQSASTQKLHKLSTAITKTLPKFKGKWMNDGYRHEFDFETRDLWIHHN